MPSGIITGVCVDNRERIKSPQKSVSFEILNDRYERDDKSIIIIII